MTMVDTKPIARKLGACPAVIAALIYVAFMYAILAWCSLHFAMRGKEPHLPFAATLFEVWKVVAWPWGMVAQRVGDDRVREAIWLAAPVLNAVPVWALVVASRRLRERRIRRET